MALLSSRFTFHKAQDIANLTVFLSKSSLYRPLFASLGHQGIFSLCFVPPLPYMSSKSQLFIPRIKLSRGAMATVSIYAAVPAVAAAAGFYFIDRNYIKENKQGFSAPNAKMIPEVNEQAKTLQKPKLAPQLDGLHCFETLVMI
ncbi:hypothetical protein VNO77_10016 [Canavalia gladiata]|uniref:Uncharacterized protein n=1 Tax=Canavalia gladiata TaxID=3824 RepID=A0AAN9QXC3_CANGL